jgi:hypothetical protein
LIIHVFIGESQMLKVLAQLEKLAESLDSKKQHKFADEVESIMGEMVSKASPMRKKAERLSGEDIPPAQPELSEVGDPYEYGYLAKRDVFVVTSPKGRGTVISKDGPYATSYSELQGRMPQAPQASGPIQPEIDPGIADNAKRKFAHLLVHFGQHLRSGAYGQHLEMAVKGTGFLNRVAYHPKKVLLTEVQHIRASITKMFDDLGEKMPTDRQIYLNMGGDRLGSPAYSLSEFFDKIEEQARIAQGGTPSGTRHRMSSGKNELEKQASLGFDAAMEVAFHSPTRTPFGR